MPGEATAPAKDTPVTDGGKLFDVKCRATFRAARLILLVHGLLGVIAAAVLTLVSAGLFHANPLFAFCGSFVACTILLLGLVPVKPIWQSYYTTVCQERGLYAEADRLAFSGVRQVLDEILSGRTPSNVDMDMRLQLAQVQLIFIRRGDMLKATRVAEFLSRGVDGSQDPYTDTSLASLYIEVGRYDEGFQILRRSLAGLDGDGRANSPAAVTTIVSLISGLVALHKVEEAESNLRRLKTIVDGGSEDRGDLTDLIIRIDAARSDIDLAFYWYYLGRLLLVKGDAGAVSTMEKARVLMRKPENSRILTLFLPEIELAMAEASLQGGDLSQASALAQSSLKLYETTTRYRGPDYHRGRIVSARAVMLKGGENNLEVMEDALRQLTSQYEPVHPVLATCLVYLAESQIRNNDFAPALLNLQKAREIYDKLFSENDQTIQNIDRLVATIPGA